MKLEEELVKTPMTQPSSSRCFARICAIVVCLLTLASGAAAQPVEDVASDPAAAGDGAAPRVVVVGTKVAPPFVMRSPDGGWSGISIDLWAQVAVARGWQTQFKAFETASDVVASAAAGEIDVGISALSVTAEREKTADFTHPYYRSGLAIAVSSGIGSDWMNLARALTSGPFLATVGALLALLFATGAVMWLIERNHNAEQFPKDPMKGVGSGFWWSAVTMTTVGYGDKAPVTLLGRAIAVVWMFAALILTAVFTAQLTSSLTLEQISGPVRGVEDLNKARVGILEGASSREYFEARGIYTRKFPDIQAGLSALDEGRIDALVHDAPLLRFEIARDSKGNRFELLPDLFETQNYAAVLPEGSVLREAINQTLLDIVASDAWPAIQTRYLGADDE